MFASLWIETHDDQKELGIIIWCTCWDSQQLMSKMEYRIILVTVSCVERQSSALLKSICLQN
uniref:Uncharacterized protein n=1 Tax=Arundo donax TaxID=35708 RepID=A0A0A9F3Y3_ARUDO